MSNLPFPAKASYLSVKEVADLFRVCPKTVRRWIASENLPLRVWVRTVQPDGSILTGERVINTEQAAIIRRIFEKFASGHSPRGIARELNANCINGPRGKGWRMSTIYGNWRRGTGILNNELYVGRLIWNRQRYIKDPNTGKRQAQMNPQDAWVIEAVPQLRIIPDDLWERVKARQKATRSEVISDGVTRSERARRPKHLFSGLLTCGHCGGGFTVVGKAYFGCANARNKGTCDNFLTSPALILKRACSLA